MPGCKLGTLWDGTGVSLRHDRALEPRKARLRSPGLNPRKAGTKAHCWGRSQVADLVAGLGGTKPGSISKCYCHPKAAIQIQARC